MKEDTIHCGEHAGVGVALQREDGLIWHCHTLCEKYHGDWTGEEIEAGLAGKPYAIEEREGNLLVTNGANLIWKALRGDAPTYFSAANSRIGVGDSAAVAAAAQTDLQGTNKLRNAMVSGWPKVGTGDSLATDNLMQFKASFADAEANWHWQEWAVFNAASGATSMLNRKVEDLGTKATGTWTLTVTLSLA